MKGGHGGKGAVGDGANKQFNSGYKFQLNKDGGCFICGSKEHKKNACPNRDKGNGNGGKETEAFRLLNGRLD